MTSIETISILGCGWLGLPLAEHFISNGFSVKGSTTSASKVGVLPEAGILPFLFDISDTDANVRDFFKADVLVIAIPPKKDFTDKLLKWLPMMDMPVILISSTSVYGKTEGLITEMTPAAPETENTREMVAAENIFLGRGKSAVLRLGGLTGPDRHPVFHLAGRGNLADPEAPVNLVHQIDAIRLIDKIIETGKWEVFNGVYPEYSMRRDYYESEAKKRGLPLPEFQSTGHKGKMVSSEKAIRELDFIFAEKP